MMTHAGLSPCEIHSAQTQNRPAATSITRGRNSRRARKPSCSGRSSSTLASAVWSCSGRSSSTLASAVCQSTFARLRSWRAVPTLLSAASRRTWRADHRGGGRNVDAGGRGRAMSVLVCSKAAIRAVGWTDAEERCREAASTLGQNAA